MRTSFICTCLSFAALIVSLGVSGCGSNTATTTLDPTSFGNSYKISNNAEMPGWKQDPTSTLWTGKGTNLHNKIDGAEPMYLDRGCLFAMYQELVGPDPQLCELVAMDFGTDANATSMFTYQQQQTPGNVPIPGYDTSAAIGSSVIAGITAYAHIRASYFEVQLSGYTDDASAAKVAAQFLGVLKAKTK